MIALSILQANGYTNIIDVIGGFDAMLKTDLAKTNYVCPSTLK
jgi:hypothetical protein